MVWAAVLLILAEGALRVRAWRRYGDHGPVADVYEVDPQLGRRPRPGSKAGGKVRSVSINRWGFRGADVPRQKPTGTVRIAAIGDSTTFGLEAASDEAVWVAKLVSCLGPWSFDAINGAVPGYTLGMSIERLERDIAPFDPDIVVVLQAATDIAAHSRRQFAARGESSKKSFLSRSLEEHSLLVNVVRQNAAPLLARWLPAQRHDRLDERGVGEYAGRLMRLVATCREKDWRPVLCTMPRSFGEVRSGGDQYVLAGTALMNNPSLSLAGLNDAYDRYNDAIREVGRATGATVVDLDRLIPRGGTYFVDATHLNDAGHVVVAEHVAGVLLPDKNLAAAQIQAASPLTTDH